MDLLGHTNNTNKYQTFTTYIYLNSDFINEYDIKNKTSKNIN